jgi:asparagine synthase (glutamine-hydrolysing)
VLLTGEGADEMFGGYRWQHATYRRWRLRAWMMRLFPRLAGRNLRRRWHGFPLRGMWVASEQVLWTRLSMGLDADNALLPRRLVDRLAGLPSLADRAFFACGVADMTGILSLLLHRHDHLGMSASIEMRVPFLENHLIDLALHLPRHAKLNRGRGKWVEKIAARERLPREIVFAKKRAFPIPADFMRGSERLLREGMLADQFGWSRATAEAIIGDSQWAADLRSDAVGMELWLRQRFGGETAEAQGETLARLAHAPQ